MAVTLTTKRELVKITTWHNSFYDDWDNGIVVYDRAKDAIGSEITDSTRFGVGERDWTLVEATEEDIARVRELSVETCTKGILDRAETKAERIERGKRVKVVRGRKVPIGTEGTVGWYGEGRWGFRVGIDTDDGERVWTDLGNVEVERGEVIERDEAEALAREALDAAETLGAIWAVRQKLTR